MTVARTASACWKGRPRAAYAVSMSAYEPACTSTGASCRSYVPVPPAVTSSPPTSRWARHSSSMADAVSGVHLGALTWGRSRGPGSAAAIAARLCSRAPASTTSAGVTSSPVSIRSAQAHVHRAPDHACAADEGIEVEHGDAALLEADG